MTEKREQSDVALVKAACDGDVDSFRRLYDRYYKLAFGIARSRLSDRHLAEDAAQEAFAVACQKLHTLRNAHRFPEWLGTICRRTANKMERWQSNGELVKDEPAREANSDERAAAAVRDAVEQLPLASKEVVYLRYFCAMSYEEIARSLGMSSKAVHGRLQRARLKLGRQLSDDD